MGEIQIPVSGQGKLYWSNYMGQKLQAVVRDWVARVESGNLSHDGTWYGTKDLISVEHLRIAKAFLSEVPAYEVDHMIMPKEVQEEVEDHLKEMPLQDQEAQAHIDS